MPLYEFVCPQCSRAGEKIISVEERNNEQICECGGNMVRSYDTGFHKPFTPYYSKQLDAYFVDRAEERAYMKKNGVLDISGDFEWNRPNRRKYGKPTKTYSWRPTSGVRREKTSGADDGKSSSNADDNNNSY